MIGNVRAAWKKRWPLFMVGALCVIMGCASKPPAKPSGATPSDLEGKTIYKIGVSEDKTTTLVTMHANEPLTYTAVKVQFPLGVVLYFRDTALHGIEESYTPDSTLIKSIQTSELNGQRPSSRIEILLNEDVPYEVTREENNILARFSNPAVQPEEAEGPEKAVEIAQQVEAQPQADERPQPVAAASVTTEAAAPVTTEEVKAPGWINRIDFEILKEGKSRVIVGTTKKVEYETEEPSDKRLLLKLFNTRIPRFQKRPLITTRFKSAVDHVVPVQTPQMGDTAVIAIQLREAVPYTIEQKDNIFILEFGSTTVPPKPMPEAELPEWVKAMKEAEEAVAKQELAAKEAAKEVVAVEDEVEEKEQVEAPPKEIVTTAEGKIYTGEKISLDFQDADIHNIFRILHEVSGKNFVIGQDVKGRVTLKLDNVPWDQVLDLILRMNKLGTAVEGNVVRIATLSSLASEQKAVEVRLKADEAAEKMEPLEEETVWINYANASDLKARIAGLKTARGTIDVDPRTNTISIRDVRSVIQDAKKRLKKLDIPTPQVMIEARIVEADTTFTRDLGIQWGGDVTDTMDQTTARLFGGQTYSATSPNYAVNLPPGSFTSGLGFTFGKFAGTPFNLDVRLLAMESQGKGRTISAPKIVTLNNEEASIEQGVEIPYQVIEEGTASLKWAKAVLSLTVKPQISGDNRISLEITCKKDAPDWANAVGGTPAISKRQAKTKLLVNDGETIVIGGILTDTDEWTEKRVPFLSRIPVLGWLFRSKYKYNKKEELLIFITPKIIRLEAAPQVTS